MFTKTRLILLIPEWMFEIPELKLDEKFSISIIKKKVLLLKYRILEIAMWIKTYLIYKLEPVQ